MLFKKVANNIYNFPINYLNLFVKIMYNLQQNKI
jgi:hypothetical protein